MDLKEHFPLIILLDNIRSAYNVGAILRVADCAGIEAVYTCGYTPNASHPKVVKTALDAEKNVQTRHFPGITDAVKELAGNGYKVYALESGVGARNLWEVDLPRTKTAFILGNEVEGVQLDAVRDFRVETLEIPMYGIKESLNVSTAMAIATYDLIKRWI